MQFETKYNIGDEVLVLKQSKAQTIKINSIIISEIGIRYSDSVGYYVADSYPESECFATIDELIEYIKSE